MANRLLISATTQRDQMEACDILTTQSTSRREIEKERKQRSIYHTIQAFNKLLYLQNYDLLRLKWKMKM